MIDVLLQIGAAKLVVSAVLAGVAWVVRRRVEHPVVAHSLWLVVLVALLLPAVVAIPVLPGQNGAAAVIAEDATLAGEVAGGEASAASPEDPESGTPFPPRVTGNTKAVLLFGWLVVAAALLMWTLLRALRFRHWLARTSLPAPQELRDEVSEIGRSLGLARLPEVHTTTARVSPMVCWTGGMIRVVIPSFLLASLDRQELRAVLAHELAHVRRRDHCVRWIEWLACSAFWWNPLAWWARRELRAAEEASCDAIGMTAIESTPHSYAESLLRVVELISTPPTPSAPSFASGAASGRNPKALERRLRMLISGRSTVQTPRWIRAAGTAAGACLLPLGLVYCGLADQPTPTDVEDTAEPVPLAAEAAGEQSTDLRPGVWRVEMAMPGTTTEASVTYYLADAAGISGPHSLVNRARLPAGCQWLVDPVGDTNREESLKICADELAFELRMDDDSEAGSVCLGQSRPNGAWRGHCRLWVASTTDEASELTSGQVWELQEMMVRTR